jgi:uncharacterized membrane protein YgaE (UPF0421/DUF939 family)
MQSRLTPERPRDRLRRLRGLRWPILETAGAAVVAWYLAKLLLSGEESAFAPIAAIICLGATFGQQRERALQLTGGVVVGVLIADLLILAIGTGPPQVGLMVVLAMSAAALLGGATLLIVEAGVSAVIIGSAAPTGDFILQRPVEALIGGGVAFVVHLLVFPPNPRLLVGRAANEVFSGLGSGLEQLAAALRTSERERAEQALATMRGIDAGVRALGDALQAGRETARSAPLRWADRAALERQDEISRHLDYACATRGSWPGTSSATCAAAALRSRTWPTRSTPSPRPSGRWPPPSRRTPTAPSPAPSGCARTPRLRDDGRLRRPYAHRDRRAGAFHRVDLVRAAQAGDGDGSGDEEATEEMLATPDADPTPPPARPRAGGSQVGGR